MIRIIAGTYGLRRGGNEVPDTEKSGPNSLTDRQENERVARQIAVFVDGGIPVGAADARNRAEKGKDAERNVPEGALEGMKLAELKEIARSYGINPDGVNRKADLIAAIREVQAEEDTVEDDEEPPQLEAEGIV